MATGFAWEGEAGGHAKGDHQGHAADEQGDGGVDVVGVGQKVRVDDQRLETDVEPGQGGQAAVDPAGTIPQHKVLADLDELHGAKVEEEGDLAERAPRAVQVGRHREGGGAERDGDFQGPTHGVVCGVGGKVGGGGLCGVGGEGGGVAWVVQRAYAEADVLLVYEPVAWFHAVPTALRGRLPLVCGCSGAERRVVRAVRRDASQALAA